MESKYYVKMNNMFLKELYVSDESAENEFIQEVEFSVNCEYCNKYNEKQAYCIIEKLITIGFDKESLYIKGVDE